MPPKRTRVNLEPSSKKSRTLPEIDYTKLAAEILRLQSLQNTGHSVIADSSIQTQVPAPVITSNALTDNTTSTCISGLSDTVQNIVQLQSTPT